METHQRTTRHHPQDQQHIESQPYPLRRFRRCSARPRRLCRARPRRGSSRLAQRRQICSRRLADIRLVIHVRSTTGTVSKQGTKGAKISFP